MITRYGERERRFVGEPSRLADSRIILPNIAVACIILANDIITFGFIVDGCIINRGEPLRCSMLVRQFDQPRG